LCSASRASSCETHICACVPRSPSQPATNAPCSSRGGFLPGARSPRCKESARVRESERVGGREGERESASESENKHSSHRGAGRQRCAAFQAGWVKPATPPAAQPPPPRKVPWEPPVPLLPHAAGSASRHVRRHCCHAAGEQARGDPCAWRLSPSPVGTQPLRMRHRLRIRLQPPRRHPRAIPALRRTRRRAPAGCALPAGPPLARGPGPTYGRSLAQGCGAGRPRGLLWSCGG